MPPRHARAVRAEGASKDQNGLSAMLLIMGLRAAHAHIDQRFGCGLDGTAASALPLSGVAALVLAAGQAPDAGDAWAQLADQRWVPQGEYGGALLRGVSATQLLAAPRSSRRTPSRDVDGEECEEGRGAARALRE